VKLSPGYFLALCAGLLLIPFASHADRDPITESKTNIFLGTLFPGKMINFDPENDTRDLTSTWIYGVQMEVPIHEYFQTGFVLSGTTGFAEELGNGQTAPAFWTVSLSGLLKPQVPIPLPAGHLSAYLSVPIGLTVTLPTIRLLMDSLFKPTFSPVGAGINAAAMLGVEYFPVPIVGLFAEGGIQTMMLWNPYPAEGTYFYSSGKYHQRFVYAPGLNFGVKLTF
jgi:hypothetical protein